MQKKQETKERRWGETGEEETCSRLASFDYLLAKSDNLVCRNIVTVNMMEAVGEAQVFAERTGLGTAAMEELIAEAFGPVAGGYSKR